MATQPKRGRPTKLPQIPDPPQPRPKSGAIVGIQTVEVMIRGVAPILQHRFTERDESEDSTRTIHVPREDPRTQAENACYRAQDGGLYFPGAAISRLLREAGSSHKEKGSRRSLKYVIPAAVIVTSDIVRLLEGGPNSLPITEFEVDSRPIVIPSTKGRIMRHRPKINEWCACFIIEIDRTLVDINMIHQLLTEGGRRIGIGDFRPEKGGPFGRFQVDQWQTVD